MAERTVGQLSLADALVTPASAGALDQIARSLNWEPIAAVLGSRSAGGAGCQPYPGLLLLRCLLLGVWNNLSDPELERQIADRLSFRRFVGLGLHEKAPDHTTLWRFRNELAAGGLVERLFEEINRQLAAQGLIVKRGTLIDASLITAQARPPRKSKSEGEQGKPSHDADARWGRKGNKSVFGYKVHIGVDAEHTIIRKVVLTDASVTDTEPADDLICGDEQGVYGDQAYYTHARHARLHEKGIKDRLMRRPNKHHPKLPPRQKLRNRLIGRVRAAVERPFAVFKTRYGFRRMRFFTMARNRAHTVLACCAYNLRRTATVLATA